MSINKGGKIRVYFLVIVIVFGGFGTLIYDQRYSQNFAESGNLNATESVPNFSPTTVLSPVQTGPMNAFPGQLINESYYLGSTSPSASYYEVTVTLNDSSYETLNAFPTYSTLLSPSGYYLLFSFQMPNDQPGMWWNVGFEIIPITISTVQEEVHTQISAQGDQIWMQYPTESMAGNYMITGGANYTFTYNVSAIKLYPSNPEGSIIVSSQVNSWKYAEGILEIHFSLYENVQSSGSTVPPISVAYVSYSLTSLSQSIGTPFYNSGYQITLIQGNGAYLMGITSSQIAEITNSLNQTLSIPISQLNAAVVSINGDIADIQTSFGTMTTQLDSIETSISGIRSGVAYLNTTLGEISTSLTSIDATISGVEGNVVTLETSVGTVSTNIDSINASINGIYKGQADVLTDLGTIQVSLSDLNATILSVKNGQATIITDVGILQTSLSTLSTTVTSVSAGEVQIDTDIGEITTSIKSLNASFRGMNGSDAVIRTDIGSITTSLNSINATIFSIHQGEVEMNTSLGNIQVSLKLLNSSILEISGDTAKIMTSAGEITTTLNDLNTSIFDTSGGSPWLNNTYADIETCLGNLTGTITDVSNNTATIETNLGAMTASVNSIKSLNGQSGGDPPSLFNTIVIVLLVALVAISTLAMLSSRSTLKIMGDKVK
jgi:prefoldin subunit 5